MKKIVIAGCTCVDVIKQINEYPKATLLAAVKGVSKATGGVTCNTAIDLKELDKKLNVATLALIGDDDNGKLVLDNLKKHKVDTALMKVDKNLLTGSTDVMNEDSGRRTFFHHQGANAKLTEKEFASLNKNNTQLVHVGYILLCDYLDSRDAKYGTKMAKLLHSLQQKGIETSVDIVSENTNRFEKLVPPALKYCTYAAMNETEAERITGIPFKNKNGKILIPNLKKMLIALKKCGVKKNAVIHCPELGAMINAKNEITIVPSLQLPKGYIKGSVGAGDAFYAGCIAGFLKHYSDEKTLRLASCAAAMSLAVPGATDNAKSEAACMALEKKYKRVKIC